MEPIERRFVTKAKMRVGDDSDAPRTIDAYAAVFDQWTDIGGWFREKVSKGAFKQTIKRGDVRGLINHNPDKIFGRTGVNMKLSEDDHGLRMIVTEPKFEDSHFEEVYMKVRNGLMTQCSFGFIPIKTEDDYNEDTRDIKEAKLMDTSIVTYPAYPTTTADVRSAWGYNKRLDGKMEDNKDDNKDEDPLDLLVIKLKSGDALSEPDIALLRSFIPEIEVKGPVDDLPLDTDKPVDDLLLNPTQVILERCKAVLNKT